MTSQNQDTNVDVDMVNHPLHYTSHPSGIECIDIAENLSFNVGNAFKYIFRSDLKDDTVTNLEKARFYMYRELSYITKSLAVLQEVTRYETPQRARLMRAITGYTALLGEFQSAVMILDDMIQEAKDGH
jgi:hypothetical protein